MSGKRNPWQGISLCTRLLSPFGGLEASIVCFKSAITSYLYCFFSNKTTLSQSLVLNASKLYPT